MRMIFMVVLAAGMGLVNNIAKINKHKAEAQKSYQDGDYQSALQHYQILVDSFKLDEEGVLMNYANVAYLLTNPTEGLTKGLQNQTENSPDLPEEKAALYLQTAQRHYAGLIETASTSIKSLAFNQLGVINFQGGGPQPPKEVLQTAKDLFKSALRVNPQNDDARFNYELVSKMLEQEEQKEDQDQDQDKKEDQEKKDQEQQKQDQQQNQDQKEEQSGEEDKDQPGEEKDQESKQEEGKPKESDENNSQEEQSEDQNQPQPEQSSDPPKMEEMKISEEKAKMILEAMKNAEVQYIQQNKRKATKRPESGKPDW